MYVVHVVQIKILACKKTFVDLASIAMLDLQIMVKALIFMISPHSLFLWIPRLTSSHVNKIVYYVYCKSRLNQPALGWWGKSECTEKTTDLWQRN